jgi:hypothetical protein
MPQVTECCNCHKVLEVGKVEINTCTVCGRDICYVCTCERDGATVCDLPDCEPGVFFSDGSRNPAANQSNGPEPSGENSRRDSAGQHPAHLVDRTADCEGCDHPYPMSMLDNCANCGAELCPNCRTENEAGDPVCKQHSACVAHALQANAYAD